MDVVNSSIFDYLSGKITFEEWIKVRECSEFVDDLTGREDEETVEEGSCGAGDIHFKVTEAQPVKDLSEGTSHYSDSQEEDFSSQLMEDVQGIASMGMPKPQRPSLEETFAAIPSIDAPVNQPPPWVGRNEESGDESERLIPQEDEPDTRHAGIHPVATLFSNFSVPSITLSKKEEETMSEEYEILLSAIAKLSQILQDFEKSCERAVGEKFKEDMDTTVVKRRRGPKPKFKLNYLQRLQMGHANMLIAAKEFDKAIALCMELIRQAPNSPKPFKTLGFIYEERGNHSKALQYFLIAAFLGCRDLQEWVDLAYQCFKAGMHRQALSCYNQACKLPNVTTEILWARASLHLELLEYKRALDGYTSCLKSLPKTVAKNCVEVAYDLTKLYHKAGADERAVDVLESVIQKGNLEILNLLMELLIEQKQYQKALTVMCTYSDVRIPAVNIITNSADSSGLSSKQVNLDENDADESNKNTDVKSEERGTIAFSANKDDDPTSRKKSIEPSIALEFDQTMPSTVEMGSPERLKFLSKDDGEPESMIFIPDKLPIDLRAKLAVCTIHEDVGLDVQDLLGPLFHEDIDDFGDIYLDVAESYIEKKEFNSAISYLQALTKSEKFSQAGVWLRLAKAYRAVERTEQAVDSLYKVLELAPHQVGVSLDLYHLLRDLGREDEATRVIADSEAFGDALQKPNDGKDVIVIDKKEVRHWYKKCTLLHRMGNIESLASTGYPLFSNYFSSTDFAHEVHKGAMFEMFRRVLSAMAEMRRFDTCHELLEQAGHYRYYIESPMYKVELEYFATSIAVLRGDFRSAFDCIRWVVNRDKSFAFRSVAFWNLYSYIVNRVSDRRHHRYMNRQIEKENTLLPLIVQNAHNSFISGTYRYALGEYARAYRLQPSEPMLCLLIAVSFLHYACQRYVNNRHTVILQGIIFAFHYFYLRGQTQEAYYNLGRAFYQVGLVSFASQFYIQALKFPSHGGLLANEENVRSADLQDLHREAAFNLSRIYLASGNRQLAVNILRRYCWV